MFLGGLGGNGQTVFFFFLKSILRFYTFIEKVTKWHIFFPRRSIDGGLSFWISAWLRIKMIFLDIVVINSVSFFGFLFL